MQKNKSLLSNGRYFYELNYPAHAENLVKGLINFLELQSLVDIVILCGNQSLRAHKLVLGLQSSFFKKEFEKNPNIEQVVLGGMDFAVVRCLVEYMYCGETSISEENFKYFKAAVKLLKIQTLETYFFDDRSADDVYLPEPQFLTRKANFSVAFPPNKSTKNATNNNSAPTTAITNPKLRQQEQKVVEKSNAFAIKPFKENVPINKQILPTNIPMSATMRGKRVLKKQVEQAFLKEAQASRLALTNLQKEIQSKSQTVKFIVEDTCAETCMENFIPQPEETPTTYLESLDSIKKETSQSNPLIENGQVMFGEKNSVIASGQNQFEKSQLATRNIENIFDAAQNSSNGENIYKNNEEMLSFNKQILENILPRDLQYQYGMVTNQSHLIPERQQHVIQLGNFLNDSHNSFNVTFSNLKDGLCSIGTNLVNECPISEPTTTSPLGQTSMEVSEFDDLNTLFNNFQ